MKDKIVFINPPIVKSELWGSLKGGASTLPPLGIATLAAIARENGYGVSVFDFLALETPLDEAVNAVLAAKPRWAGITATTEMIGPAVSMARELKKRAPGMTILIGGPHISAAPEETMKRYGEFDVAFIGESEKTLPEYLDCASGGRDISGVKGIMIRSEEGLRYTGKRDFVAAMDEVPFPAWDLLPDITKHYQPAVTNYKRLPYTSLVTSRGCPGQCIFCDRSVFGNRVRAFSAEYIIKMIKTLMKDYGVREVCFYDDNFLLLKDRLKKFCRLLKEEKLDLIWSCSARIDTVDKKTLDLIRKAGCWQIGYGIESGSDDILKLMKKNITVNRISDIIGASKEAGLLIRGYFILGNPGETRESLKATLGLMKKLPLDDLLVEYMTPYPGCELYDDIEKYGSGTREWDRLNTFSVNFVPKGVTEKELKDTFTSAYRDFYLKPRTIWSYMTRFRNPFKLVKLSVLFVQFLFKKG